MAQALADIRKIAPAAAEVLLQISSVCASIAILSASRPMFWFSPMLVRCGLLLTLNGFTLLIRLPFLHGH